MKTTTLFFVFLILFSCSANDRDVNEDTDIIVIKKNVLWTSKNDTIIIGQALNAKGGAIVVTYDNENPYYIDGLNYWSEKICNKKVKVSGKLLIEEIKHDLKPEEGLPQIMVGPKQTILQPKFELVDTIKKKIEEP